MAVTLYAAIGVGSYEIEMKIYQYVPRREVKVIDQIRYRIELGRDTYSTGKISIEKIDELCKVLQDFSAIMKSYKVKGYRACATSAIREASNRLLILEYVENETGIRIEILGNSEQRFLDYKGIAFGDIDFSRIIQNGTAIVDVGGGSVQVCLFDNDKMVTTQNIRIGNLRVREKLADFSRTTMHMDDMVEELIDNELESFKKMYLKDRNICNLIITGDYILELLQTNEVTAKDFMTFYDTLQKKHPEEIAREYGIPSESASMIPPSMIIYKRIIEELGADAIYLPGSSLSDGIAYDYAQRMKFIKPEHNFNDDILAAAMNIAKRYQCNKGHIKNMEKLALETFDKIKKRAGLNERDRLLLQIAVILHGCGKYISLSDGADCSYSIVMSTEIIGLSTEDRRIIANVVRYNTLDFSYDDIMEQPQMTREDYLLISKLTAILRIANAMDRSHKQKFQNVKFTLKENELVILVDSREDITLERGLFPPKADYFEEVFHIRPVIRQKKNL